jgi:hypothetical protein
MDIMILTKVGKSSSEFLETNSVFLISNAGNKLRNNVRKYSDKQNVPIAITALIGLSAKGITA